MTDSSLLAALQAENARLIASLDAHGIDWQPRVEPAPIPLASTAPVQTLDTDAKLALFRSLFKGRTDIYPLRWEGKSGKSGYAPACANEWRPGVCEKPHIKCGDCGQRQLLAVTDEVIYRHLAGAVVAGVYPLLTDDTCHFLAADFDEAEWRDDVQAFAQSCRTLGVPVAVEISRSGNGAHAWVFFASKVPASDARRLGAAIISHACERTMLSSPILVPEGSGIQDIFRRLADDSQRTATIVSAVVQAYQQGRKVLVLTQRTEHVDALDIALKVQISNLFTLHGRMPKKQRMALITTLESLPEEAPRVLLSTGTLIGEGFDHPPLDTLVLAMPVSWRGILQQYAGRLHRAHTAKADVHVIDFVDEGHSALLRMWEKRKAGYKAMGYRLLDTSATMPLL